jgi:hypothetical protein
MPTKEQLETALINADKAGDTDAARKLANALKAGAFEESDSDTQMPTAPTAPNPVLAGAAEFAAGANNAVVELLDFLGPDQINNILQLAGSEKRFPTLGEQDIIRSATSGGFVENDLARDVLRSAGGTATIGGAAGQLFRQAAGQLPKIASNAESIGAGALRQMGASTPVKDVLTGSLAGAGIELGGEAGEAMGGDEGRQAGELLGSIAAPLAPSVARRAVSRGISNKSFTESVPTIDRLKTEARAVYKEVDNMGVSINQPPLGKLSESISASVKNQGFNPRIHPKVNAALDEIQSLTSNAMTVSEIDTMRRVARSAARSIEPDEARLGSMMVRKIDDFFDTIPQSAISGSQNPQVGALLKDARIKWGRAKRSEILEEAVEKASLQASGLENGLRTQFRSILNNKRKIAGFSAEEREAMKRVVKGGKAENIAKHLGKLGFSENQASSMLLASLGVAGGAAVGGPAGAVAVPIVGQAARSLAQRLTRNNAKLADELIRAGTNGRKIANAYIKSTPKGKRSTEELTGILLNTNSEDIPALIKGNVKLISDAAYFASVILASEETLSDPSNSPEEE